MHSNPEIISTGLSILGFIPNDIWALKEYDSLKIDFFTKFIDIINKSKF